MTSPEPIPISSPICSYCWKLLENPMYFTLENREIHWACSERCKKKLIGNSKINYKNSLRDLSKMYVNTWKETRCGRRSFKQEKKSEHKKKKEMGR